MMAKLSGTLNSNRTNVLKGDFGGNESIQHMNFDKYEWIFELDQNECIYQIAAKFSFSQLKMSTLFNNSNSVANRSLTATVLPGSILEM